MGSKTTDLSKYAPAFLRIGISVVFLWFGISQLVSPEKFTGWVPSWTAAFSQASTVVFANGMAEIILGSLLLLGFFRRLVALLLGIQMLGIVFSIGYSETGVRDFGIAVAVFTVAMIKEDDYTILKMLNK